jgi:hypothetical protein
VFVSNASYSSLSFIVPTLLSAGMGRGAGKDTLTEAPGNVFSTNWLTPDSFAVIVSMSFLKRKRREGKGREVPESEELLRPCFAE